MPNSRGGFYLKEAFKKISFGEPMVLPKTVSLDNWVASYCPYQIIGEAEAVLYLFQSFKRVKNPKENLEDFFPLGQKLYSDFEEIIRNEISLPHVFTALERWEATGLGFADFLSEEQKQLLANFWANFEANNSSIGQRMLDLWKALPAIFADYELELQKEGKCTAARAYANLSIVLPTLDFPDFDAVYFAGFGELTGTERSLIRGLTTKTDVQLIWDFNKGYLDSPQHEVNRLINRLKNDQNLKESLQLSLDKEISSNCPKVELIRCQGKEGMNQWITNLAQNTEKNERVGLIILDPTLVQLIVQNSGIEDFPFNISMGFPLLSTPEALELLGYLENWKVVFNSNGFSKREVFPYSNLLKNIENSDFQFPDWIHSQNPKDGLPLLHIWLQKILPFLPDSTYDQQVWRSISASISELLRLLILAGEQNPTAAFVSKLAKGIFSSQTLKMAGKPDQGIQVMGLYESRLLDFERVIIASANDGLLPSGSNQNSLLPDSLRRAFGLLTRSQASEDEMYQAWRLTHRSAKFTLLISDDGESKPSRMAPQLLYSEMFLATQRQQKFGSSLPVPVLDEVEKNEFVLEKLKTFFAEPGQNEIRSFSPSSLYSLLQCQLKFYYSHVLELKSPEEGAELGMDVRDFGNWVHISIQESLQIWQADRQELESVEPGDLFTIWLIRNEAVWVEMKKVVSNSPLSDFFVEKEVGAVMAKRFFTSLSKLNSLRWRASEQNLTRTYLTDSQNENRKWGVEGRADLVMELESETLLLDLKTGGFGEDREYAINISKLDGLAEKLVKNKDLFQMLVYDWVIWKNRKIGLSDEYRQKVRAKLFYLANPNATFLDPMKSLENEEEESLLFAKLEEILESALSELFDSTVPFQRTEEISHCQYCEFKGICQR